MSINVCQSKLSKQNSRLAAAMRMLRSRRCRREHSKQVVKAHTTLKLDTRACSSECGNMHSETRQKLQHQLQDIAAWGALA